MGMYSQDGQALACLHSLLEASEHMMNNVMDAETIVRLWGRKKKPAWIKKKKKKKKILNVLCKKAVNCLIYLKFSDFMFQSMCFT